MDQKLLIDFLDSLSALERRRDIWERTALFFSDNGFDKIIYIDILASTSVVHTTLPPAWTEHYRASGYEKIDPFISYCCATMAPIGTGADYCPEYQYLTQAQTQLIHEAAEFQMRAGFSVTTRPPSRSAVGGWNLGSSLKRSEVEAIRGEHEGLLRLAAAYAHERLRHAPDPEAARLSPREIECLNGLALGERTKDIAQRLGLSPSAVELYLKNARTKLGALTREQAVAKALVLGVLE